MKELHDFTALAGAVLACAARVCARRRASLFEFGQLFFEQRRGFDGLVPPCQWRGANLDDSDAHSPHLQV